MRIASASLSARPPVLPDPLEVGVDGVGHDRPEDHVPADGRPPADEGCVQRRQRPVEKVQRADEVRLKTGGRGRVVVVAGALVPAQVANQKQEAAGANDLEAA